VKKGTERSAQQHEPEKVELTVDVADEPGVDVGIIDPVFGDPLFPKVRERKVVGLTRA
jgi:hypothetical protein